jgi:hypothetical protein
VIGLLDRDVRYGQGSLFSPPRPVRPEALQAMPEFPDPVTANEPARQISSLRRMVSRQLRRDDAEQGPLAQIAAGVPARG